MDCTVQQVTQLLKAAFLFWIHGVLIPLYLLQALGLLIAMGNHRQGQEKCFRLTDLLVLCVISRAATRLVPMSLAEKWGQV